MAFSSEPKDSLNAPVMPRRAFFRRAAVVGGGSAVAVTVGRHRSWWDTLALAAPGRAQRMGRVTVALFGLPTRIVGSTEVTAAYLFLLVHDVLARPDWTTGQPVPRLAERWERSADGRSYSIHLRSAKFQDGQPVTAEDVKFSYEFYLHPKFPTTPQGLREIEGAQDYKQGNVREVTGITVIDPRTVRITLKRRYAFFVDGILGNSYIMPKHGWAGVDMARMLEHPYARRPVGAGPYRLVDWKEGDSITLDAFADYFGGKPLVDRVVVRWIPEPSTVEAELRAGHLDAAAVLPDDVDGFRRDARFQVLRMTAEFSYWFGFNHQHLLFKDVRVRQACYHAVDRQEMVRTLVKGQGRVVNTIVPPQSLAYDPALKGYPYDPQRARQLLREAGFTGGPGGILQRDGKMFRVRYSFLSEKRYQDIALIVQQYLRQVGIALMLEPLERGDFFGRFWQPANAANIEMVGLSLYTTAPGPIQRSFETVFHSSGLWARILQYHNPEVDTLLDHAAAAVDRGALRTIYFRLQEVLAADVSWVMLFRPDELWALQRRIGLPETRELSQLFASIPGWRIP